MHVLQRANFTDRLLLTYLAGLGLLIVLQRHRVPGWPSFVLLHLFLITLVLALVVMADRWRTMHAWYPLVMPIPLFEEVALLNFVIVDGWRDRGLLVLEARLFPEPPTAWFQRIASPWLTEALAIGYLSYFVILVIVAATLDRRRDKAPFFGVMAASILSYLLCYVVFLVFPTEGPAHTLRHLHTEPLTGGPFTQLVTSLQAGAGVHGNAFPSAHAAGAVAALTFAWRYVPRLAAWLSPFVLLMCIGAVYHRYHYASDLFAGVVVGGLAAGLVMWASSRKALSLDR